MMISACRSQAMSGGTVTERSDEQVTVSSNADAASEYLGSPGGTNRMVASVGSVLARAFAACPPKKPDQRNTSDRTVRPVRPDPYRGKGSEIEPEKGSTPPYRGKDADQVYP